MAARRARGTSATRELAELSEAARDPGSVESVRAIERALGSASPGVIARAAEIARRAEIDGVGRALAAAFERLAPLGGRGDPRCIAKLALLEALDATAWTDEEPFLTASRLVQMEPAFPRAEDTATGVRARGVLALARQSWRDLPLIAAELLEDPEVPVRIAAADALAAHGARESAGPLIARLVRASEPDAEEDPMVIVAVLSALLRLAPEWALEYARRGLGHGRTIDRELAAIALGESRRDDALDLLARWLEEAPRAEERATYLRAIGLHRTERALAILLARLAEGGRTDAVAAIEALAARRFDPGVAERARDAVRARSGADDARELEPLLARALEHGGT